MSYGLLLCSVMVFYCALLWSVMVYYGLLWSNMVCNGL